MQSPEALLSVIFLTYHQEWLEHLGIKQQGKHSYFLSADDDDEVIVITDKENGIFQQFKVSETTGGFVGRIMASNVRR